MRNVLHLIDTRGGGGAERVYVQLAEGLQRRGWGAIAATGGIGWVSDALVRAGIEPHFFSSTRSFDTSMFGALLRLVRRHRVRIVQTHLLTTSAYGALLGLVTGVPVISTFHGIGDLDMSHSTMKLRLIKTLRNRVIAVSPSLLHQLVESGGVNPSRAEVIENGVDTQSFSPGTDVEWRRRLGVRDGEILIGSVGRSDPVKGFEYFLVAAAQLRARGVNARFVVIGAQGERIEHHLALTKLRSDLRLEDCFALLPFENDLVSFYRSLDIFVLPSLHEGFSLATVEAMACGVPVVATRCGGPEHIISDGIDGLLVPSADAGALASALHSLHSSSVLRRGLALHARRTVEARFSVASTLDRYERVYESVL